MVNARPSEGYAPGIDLSISNRLSLTLPLAEQIFVRLKRGRHAKSVHGNTSFLLPLGVNAKVGR